MRSDHPRECIAFSKSRCRASSVRIRQSGPAFGPDCTLVQASFERVSVSGSESGPLSVSHSLSLSRRERGRARHLQQCGRPQLYGHLLKWFVRALSHTHSIALSRSLSHTHTHSRSLSLSHTHARSVSHTHSLALSHTLLLALSHTLSLARSLSLTVSRFLPHTLSRLLSLAHTLSLALSHAHTRSLSLSHTHTVYHRQK